MPNDALPIMSLLFLLVGALYASVGHAGASGYLAIMALMGVNAVLMRPTALAINILVAAITFMQFARAGYFSWRLFWPFAIASIPAAFIGGSIALPPAPLKIAIGAVLLLSAVRMGWTTFRPPANTKPPQPPHYAVALASGGLLGLASGLTGTGGGIFLSPLMLLLNWGNVKQTAATSSLFILLNSIAGLSGLATQGWVPTAPLTALAVAACVGGLLGAHLGSRVLNNQTLRVLLSVVLLLAGAKLVSQGSALHPKPVVSRLERPASTDR